MGIRSTLKRVTDSLLDRERSREDLKIGIAGFYDRSSKLWEDVWGEVSVGTIQNYMELWQAFSDDSHL